MPRARSAVAVVASGLMLDGWVTKFPMADATGAVAACGAARSGAADSRAAPRSGVGRGRNVSRGLASAPRRERRQRLRSPALRAAPGRAQRARSRRCWPRSLPSARSTSSSTAPSIATARGRAMSRRPLALPRSPATACARPTGFPQVRRSSLPSEQLLPIVAVQAFRHDAGVIWDGRIETEWGDDPQRPAQWITRRPWRGARRRRDHARARRVRARLSADAGDRSLASTVRAGKRSGRGRPRRSHSSPPRARRARRPCTSAFPRGRRASSACASSPSTRTCGGWRS